MREVAGILWESGTDCLQKGVHTLVSLVACNIDCHEMDEISSASHLIDANIVDSAMSVMLMMLTSTVLNGDGWGDVASAASFDLPGRCAIAKCQGSVLCFSLNSLVFVISSSVQSPNIFTKGLWLVTTTKSSQPWVKKRVCSRLQAMARASPLMGAYRCSAVAKNWEPASMMRHLSVQQSGNLDGLL
jgi:hypothetical protein